DLTHSAGGSSGGEAAAIATGCSAGGVGSDGGGSIRVPAHFCGICGLKPTPGRIPATGHFPPGAGAFSWIGVVGPMARTIADVRSLVEVMAGPDAGDALSAPVPLRACLEDELLKMRIGILESDTLGVATAETRATVERAAKSLDERGFTVEPFRLDGLDRALDLWWFFFGPVIGNLFRHSVDGYEDKISPLVSKSSAGRLKTNWSWPSQRPSSRGAAPGQHRPPTLREQTCLSLRLPSQLRVGHPIILLRLAFLIQLAFHVLLRGREFRARFLLPSQLHQDSSSDEVPPMDIR